jgi:hypothetical protein
MALGGFLKSLFGGGSTSAEPGPRGDPEPYKDCVIVATPLPQGGQFLTAGVITKTFPDGPREHKFIRADTHGSADDAAAFAIQKGKQIIDEQGDRIFRQP